MTQAIRTAVLASLVLAAGSAPARAEAYLAVRSGYPCAACHVNETGGGMRSQLGADYGLRKLPGYRVPLPEGQQDVTGEIAPWLALGGDYRGANASRFSQSGTTNTFVTEEANVYADVRFLQQRLHLYADMRLAPGGTTAREIFALAENLPGKLYVKAGRFFPAYGWRLLDDDAFIRSRTGFSFLSGDDGLELGWQPGRFTGSLSVTNGNGGALDDNTNKQVAAMGQWIWKSFRAGGSFATNHQGDATSTMGNLMAGAQIGSRVVLLLEGDLRRDETTSAMRQGIGFVEATVLAAPGLNLKAAFDYHNPDKSEEGDEVNRITLGGEWFAMQHMQVRLLWRRTDRPPEVHGVTFEDDREVLLELHLFL